MTKPRLLFLDIGFHVKTRSSDFFERVLASKFEVHRMYFSSHTISAKKDKNDLVEKARALKPEVIILWQLWAPASLLVRIGVPCMWIPMLDNSRTRNSDGFVQSALLGTPIVSFSQQVTEFAAYWNLPILPLKYFPEPSLSAAIDPSNNQKVFFWYRGFVTLEDLEPVLANLQDVEIIVKDDPDPRQKKFKLGTGILSSRVLQIIDGFIPDRAYKSIVENCGIYIAPRLIEGIGLSFLEAMSSGSLVVGYDFPTMNEYIRSGQNGWLFNHSAGHSIDADNILSIRTRALEDCRNGHLKWLQDTRMIYEVIEHLLVPRYRLQLKFARAFIISVGWGCRRLAREMRTNFVK